MAVLTLQGNEINTNGELPKVGSNAPDFMLVNSEMEDVSLTNYQGKKKLLSIVPSLDTPVCAMSTKKFDKLAKVKIPSLEGILSFGYFSSLLLSLIKFVADTRTKVRSTVH